MTMPMRHIPFTPGPTCTCTPPDKNDWKVTQFTQGIKTIKCEKCGISTPAVKHLSDQEAW